MAFRSRQATNQRDFGGTYYGSASSSAGTASPAASLRSIYGGSSSGTTFGQRSSAYDSIGSSSNNRYGNISHAASPARSTNVSFSNASFSRPSYGSALKSSNTSSFYKPSSISSSTSIRPMSHSGSDYSLSNYGSLNRTKSRDTSPLRSINRYSTERDLASYGNNAAGYSAQSRSSYTPIYANLNIASSFSTNTPTRRYTEHRSHSGAALLAPPSTSSRYKSSEIGPQPITNQNSQFPDSSNSQRSQNVVETSNEDPTVCDIELEAISRGTCTLPDDLSDLEKRRLRRKLDDEKGIARTQNHTLSRKAVRIEIEGKVIMGDASRPTTRDSATQTGEENENNVSASNKPASPLPQSPTKRSGYISSSYLSSTKSSITPSDTYYKYSDTRALSSARYLSSAARINLGNSAAIKSTSSGSWRDRVYGKDDVKEESTRTAQQRGKQEINSDSDSEQQSPGALRRKRRAKYGGVDLPPPLQLPPASSIPQAMPAAESYNKVRCWTQHMATVPPEELLPAVEDSVMNKQRSGSNLSTNFSKPTSDETSPRVFNFPTENNDEEVFFKKRASTRSTSDHLIQNEEKEVACPKTPLISRRGKYLATMRQEKLSSSPKPAPTSSVAVDMDKVTTTATAKDAMMLLHKQGSLLYEEYYTDEDIDEVDDLDAGHEEESQTLIFKSKSARLIFEEMPIQLQHMIIKSQSRRCIKMADIIVLCRNENFQRKFTAHEEKQFKGYTSIFDMLEDFGINMSKLINFILLLYRFSGAQSTFSSCLDLELPNIENWDGFDQLSESRRNGTILRLQISIEIYMLIEKLLNVSGRELKRALFSLKLIFQKDEQLVKEFINNDGLDCLIKIGSESDQTFLNYILRAFGQLILSVDGINGIIKHNRIIQWLYSLLSSKFRTVVKSSLQLLLVFVSYCETNAHLLKVAVQQVHATNRSVDWSYFMNILRNSDLNMESELLICSLTLLNKLLNAFSDQDTFYDVTDTLEAQGIEKVLRYLSEQSVNANSEIMKQIQIYENSLLLEDGATELLPMSVIRREPRKKSEMVGGKRISARRNSMNVSSTSESNDQSILVLMKSTLSQNEDLCGTSDHAVLPPPASKPTSLSISSEAARDSFPPSWQHKPNTTESGYFSNEGSGEQPVQPNEHKKVHNKISPSKETQLSPSSPLRRPSLACADPLSTRIHSLDQNHKLREESPKNRALADLSELQKSGGVRTASRALQQKCQEVNSTPERGSATGDCSGIIELAKSDLKTAVVKATTCDSSVSLITKAEVVRSQSDIQWELLERNLRRALRIRDLDFTDLHESDEEDFTKPKINVSLTQGPGVPPPPPPPIFNKSGGPSLPPAPPPPAPPPPPSRLPGASLEIKPSATTMSAKTKRTLKLHWKELRHNLRNPVPMRPPVSTIWEKVVNVNLDTAKLETLFETKVSELKLKKAEANVRKSLNVLDGKRSNAINIGMTVLPPPRTIKHALLKMDASVMSREALEKLLLCMLPSEEEIKAIVAAQIEQPDTPLGSAEQFLLTLSSINELQARLELWLFKLDYEALEAEVSDPLADLKIAIQQLRSSDTLLWVISTLLAMGNFLNGNVSNAFDLDYLAKVPEVKDTIHKHSLLYHVAASVLENFPQGSDLHSELGAVTRCSRVDWNELADKLAQLEQDCKRSWEHLQRITQQDGSQLKQKMSEFLHDAAERILLLKIVHRRVVNRFRMLLLYFGMPAPEAAKAPVRHVCKVLSEFALEYRTTREKVEQQLSKKLQARERKKSRGKDACDNDKVSPGSARQASKKNVEDDNVLQQLLKQVDADNDVHVTGWGRARNSRHSLERNLRSDSPNGSAVTKPRSASTTNGDDESLEACLLGSPFAGRRSAPRDGRRSMQRDRKSLGRTLQNGISEKN